MFDVVVVLIITFVTVEEEQAMLHARKKAKNTTDRHVAFNRRNIDKAALLGNPPPLLTALIDKRTPSVPASFIFRIA